MQTQVKKNKNQQTKILFADKSHHENDNKVSFRVYKFYRL